MQEIIKFQWYKLNLVRYSKFGWHIILFQSVYMSLNNGLSLVHSLTWFWACMYAWLVTPAEASASVNSNPTGMVGRVDQEWDNHKHHKFWSQRYWAARPTLHSASVNSNPTGMVGRVETKSEITVNTTSSEVKRTGLQGLPQVMNYQWEKGKLLN